MEQLRLVSVEGGPRVDAPADPKRSLEWIRQIRRILERTEIPGFSRAG